jgi:hypothetical protein
MIGSFGPWHDRVQLTSEEARIIARLERAMAPFTRRRLATRGELRSSLNVFGWVLLACLSFRRRAIWLIPLGTLGVAVTLPMSLLLAAMFAALWWIGIAAAISEISVRIGSRHRARW